MADIYKSISVFLGGLHAQWMQHRGYIEDEQTAIISGKPDFIFVDISYMALLSFNMQ
jgi:hypothetical protein